MDGTSCGEGGGDERVEGDCLQIKELHAGRNLTEFGRPFLFKHFFASRLEKFFEKFGQTV